MTLRESENRVHNYLQANPPGIPRSTRNHPALGDRREGGRAIFAVRVAGLEKGAATPLHSHDHDFEHGVFILTGRGKVYGGGEEAALSEGDAVFTAPMEEHRFVNEDDRPFRFSCAIPLPGK